MFAATPDSDLFATEAQALASARAVHDDASADPQACRAALGELVLHYERLMRETRRLIRRSDRAELDMNQLNRQLHELAGQLEYRATHDPLTGALNRGAVIDQASACLAAGDAALIVLDIDHFKQVNDDFGHPTGDVVIKTVVLALRTLLGADVAVGRVGGEEFSVIWPTRSQAEAVTIAQMICNALALQCYAAPVDRPITVSVGVSWNSAGTAFETAYALADEALYEAKRGGRNRIGVAP